MNGVFSTGNVVKATLLDNFLITPVMFFPCYYVFKDVIAPTAIGLPLCDGSTAPSTKSIVSALEHYRKDVLEQLCGVWAVWIPAHLIMFSVVPVHLRVTYSNCVALGYAFVLSFVTARLDKRAAAATAPGTSPDKAILAK
jgi:protein Mpv17